LRLAYSKEAEGKDAEILRWLSPAEAGILEESTQVGPSAQGAWAVNKARRNSNG
jgi:hypothetical protein